MLMNSNEYITVVDTIKKEIRSAQYRTAVQANTELLRLYYSIGKEINVHKVWGNKFIENLSMDIRADYPTNKGFSVRNLKYMAKFAATYSDRVGGPRNQRADLSHHRAYRPVHGGSTA